MSGDSTSNDTINLLYESDGNQRLDQYLAENLPEFSRVRIKKLIDNGMVLVNGQQEKASLKLRGGERISIEIPPVSRRLSPPKISISMSYTKTKICLWSTNRQGWSPIREPGFSQAPW